jgi:prephenate dehydrogenase
VSATVAILGHGRFGATLAGLLQDRGFAVRALDPRAPVPDALRVAGPAELTRGAEFVVLAVPLPATRAALAGLRPHLVREQTVLDVGSVKQLPAAAMRELLGEALPWVATHPLFGPDSVALGEPLRAVICPNPLHPHAVKRVTGLYRALGCRTVEMDPEHHDRTMAQTHALTYFVTKGMLDIGVDEAIPFAPPSFRAMAQTIDAVRSDAGHLFDAIHRENPHAAAARSRLLEALTAVDRALRGPGSHLDIPPAGDPSPGTVDDPLAELGRIRAAIDACDQQLLELLHRRVGLALRAGRAKARLGRPVLDAARERELLADRLRRAAELGFTVEPDLLDAIFEAVLRLSRRVQHEEETP